MKIVIGKNKKPDMLFKESVILKQCKKEYKQAVDADVDDTEKEFLKLELLEQLPLNDRSMLEGYIAELEGK